MSVTAYIRAGLVLVVLGLAAWGGWATRGWLEDSHALEKANKERDAAQDRERAAERKAQEAEAARAKSAADLKAEKDKVHAEIAPIIKRVPVYIGGSDCALPPDSVSELNAARGSTMPDAERRVTGETWTTRPDPN